MNHRQDFDYHAQTHSSDQSLYWEWYGVLNPYIVIDDHSYDGNHLNAILDLTD